CETSGEPPARPSDLDVLDAFPLGVVDDAPTILADMDARRDIAVALAHEDFCTLFANGDQLLLILGIDGKDVDQRHDPAVGGNVHLHRLSPCSDSRAVLEAVGLLPTLERLVGRSP